MSGVYYRSGTGRPRAANGQFLPWKPSPRSRSQEPSTARPEEPPQPNAIVQRYAHLPGHVIPGLGGITDAPGSR
jgi:hypothetical protein